MRNYISLILTFFALTSAFAKPVTISGTAGTYYHGQKLYLTQLHETFLSSKSIVSQTKISLTGQFSISVECDDIESIELISAFVTFPFRIQSGANYTIELQNPNEKEYVSIANTMVKEVLFFDLPESDINHKIIDFNNTLDSLVDAELTNFNPRSYTLQLAVFHQKFDNAPDYFRHYAQSAIASQLLNFERDKKLFFQNYILHNPLNLKVSESTILLSKFYENAIQKLLRFEKEADKAKIRNADAVAYFNMFKKWDFTPTPFLRDFAALSNAYNAYHDKFYTKQDLIILLENLKPLLSDKSVIQALEAIENEMGLHFKEVLKPMVDKIEIDQSKKIIALCFYSLESEISRRELTELEAMITTQKLPVQIVKYCTDCSASDLTSDMEMALDKDPMVFEKLRLFSLPKFTLVDRNANILTEWLEPPSHGAERQIKTILNRIDRP
jgi:hypothetical protein